jgi:hypothetical protein
MCYDVDNTTIVKVKSMIEIQHILLKYHNCNLNRCELDKHDLDRYDMCQGGVKMMWVNRYDRRIYCCTNEIS